MPPVSLSRLRRAVLAGLLLAPLTLGGTGAASALDQTGPELDGAAATEVEEPSAATAGDTTAVDVMQVAKVKPAAAAVLQSVSAQAAARSTSRSAAGTGTASTGVGQATPSGISLGTQKLWPAYDFSSDTTYPKTYTLRGVGSKAQIWVADDRAFPTGDCRNTLGLTDITDAQVASFLRQFDDRIYPVESAAFSALTSRNGRNAGYTGPDSLAEGLDLPAAYYKVNAAEAGQVVILVDNVRDTNYYEPASAAGKTYTTGFFGADFSDGTGRNVMTVDAYDWLHRTGANPPDDSAAPAYQACGAANQATAAGRYGTARPFNYEATFAHEYQHLLENDVDPAEQTWVNEGLSSYAPTLLGYVNARRGPTQADADPGLACFDGYLGESYGGAENSLTEWGDQGEAEILCDYGAAHSYLQYLVAQYGPGVLTKLHRNPGIGLAGVDAVLDQLKAKKSAMETIHDWAVTVAVDNQVSNANTVIGGTAALFTADTLSSKVNWANPQSYDAPGAVPNGSDYVRFRKANGKVLTPAALTSLSFAGAATLPPAPMEWSVDGGGLYAGTGDNLDRSIARSVTVPATGGTLSFQAAWSIEEGYDLAAVQVSTDGGASWTSLATQDTTDSFPDADSALAAQAPGFTGDSGGWRTQTADLSAYAGSQVLLAFRYLTDVSTSEDGFRVRKVSVAGQWLPTGSLAGWQTQTQLRPTPVAGWTVRLISYDRDGVVHLSDLAVQPGQTTALTQKALTKALGDDTGVAAAIVMQDDPTESASGAARYTLSVNGVVQQGG